MGFTLIELLIVITILAVLAVALFAVPGKVREKARASKRLADIRQSGSMLITLAAENNGRCAYFSGGTGNFEYRPYLMIRREIRIHENSLLDIMHWDADKLPPNAGNQHWNCRAVNFQNVTYPDGTSTRWIQQNIKDGADRAGNLKTLSLASIARPWSYPLLIDSSNSGGMEIFRINEANGDFVGLRESGKAGAFLFDGSSRLMDKADLKKSGFTKVYDNSTKPPKVISL
jgi:prepilin-type N-terminal cleavage/methylation domain-containing protein